MNHFYFNNLIFGNKTQFDIEQLFIKTLYEYKELSKILQNQIDGVITEKIPEQVKLLDEYTLRNCILGIEDKDLKKFALSLFRKYPFENFSDYNEESLESECFFEFEEQKISIKWYWAIISFNDGVLFSLASHTILENELLSFTCNNNKKNTVLNLYGKQENTNKVLEVLKEKIFSNLDNFDKLISLFKNCKFSDDFKSNFESESFSFQITIIEHFKKAIGRNLITPLQPDGNLIKDVSIDKTKVSELRIFSPKAYRIYFQENSEVIILASLEKKPSAKTQNNDIRIASERIVFMIGQLNSN